MLLNKETYLLSLLFYSLNIYIYIYIYRQIDRQIDRILFDPVKPRLGVIPSRQEKYSRVNISNFPGKELNVTDKREQ